MSIKPHRAQARSYARTLRWSATAARAAGLDATAGQRSRIQQTAQIRLAEPAVFQRHVQHRALFLVGTLGDRRGLLVADDRVERGDQDRIAVSASRTRSWRTFNPAIALSASSRATLPSKLIESSRL